MGFGGIGDLNNFSPFPVIHDHVPRKRKMESWAIALIVIVAISITGASFRRVLWYLGKKADLKNRELDLRERELALREEQVRKQFELEEKELERKYRALETPPRGKPPSKPKAR